MVFAHCDSHKNLLLHHLERVESLNADPDESSDFLSNHKKHIKITSGMNPPQRRAARQY